MTITSPRRRLAGGFAASLLAAAALTITIAAPASAASSDAILTLTVSTDQPNAGTPFTATVQFTPPTSAPAGNVVIGIEQSTSNTNFERIQHVTSATTVSESISDLPLGNVQVLAIFQPDNGGSADTVTQSVHVVQQGTTVALSTTKLVAGRTNQVIATVTTPIAATTFDGAVHLEIGTTADAAICTPKPVTSMKAQCTLTVPAFPVGTKPANASWNGSEDFAEADFTTTLSFAAAPAGSASGGSASGSSTTKHPSSSPTANSSSSASAAPASTEPSPKSNPSTPASSHTPSALAARTDGAVSALPALFALGGVIALLVIAGVVVLVLFRRRRASR